MYPGTQVIWDDQSSTASVVAQETVTTQPLYMQAFTSDKGPEKLGVYSGDEFFNAFGKDISFAKHGQPLLQTAMSIKWGAKVLCQRVVADDATLANIGIKATVASAQVQKQNENGELLYTDAQGNETIESDGTTAIMVNKATITYTILTAANAKTAAAAKEALVTAAGNTEGSYLLWMFADNGRGVSKKRIRIAPNYTVSRSTNYTQYEAYVIENGETEESFSFLPAPSSVVNGANVSLASVMSASQQIDCVQFDANIDAFIAKIKTITTYTDDQIAEYDILFGCNKKGAALYQMAVDLETGVNLQSAYGQVLTSGTNGSFADAPMADTTYATQMVKAFNGGLDKGIFDLDKYKIDAIIDCGYPEDVKRAIETLGSFREDYFFFRDLGKTGLTSVDLITAADIGLKSKFCGTYCQYFDILDPYSKKQITVTSCYDIARLIVKLFNINRSIPLAGIQYGMTFDDAIEGTVSFTPILGPSLNEKDQLEDARINYASYIDDQLVLETLFTSQEKFTQLSYVNNILLAQEVVKAVRTKCPAIRYSFLDGDDLSDYKSAVILVLEPYQTYFKSLTFEYVGDSTYTANKIFYGAIKVQFRDFVQSEIFKITALSADATVTA